MRRTHPILHKAPQFHARSRLAASAALSIGLLTIGLPAAIATDNPATGPDKIHKVFVCKYVGTPGVDERLQTGNNPILVDGHSTDGAQVGSSFNDRQGRSLVLAVDNGEAIYSVADCPPGDTPVVDPPVVDPPVVDPPVVEPPVVHPPVVDPPVVEPPVVEPPVVDPPVVDPPVLVLGVEASVNPLPTADPLATGNPLPVGAEAGQANSSGPVAAAGLAGFAAFLALGAGLVLRRRGEV